LRFKFESDVEPFIFYQSKQVKLEHPKLTCDATVQEAIHEAAAIMGENLKLRRGFCISAEAGLVSSYLHMSPHQGS
jgi:translation elongation factor EF-Ts